MTKYRIVPYGLDEWRIQRRWFLIWRYVDEWGQASSTVNKVCRTEAEAKRAILAFLYKERAERAKWKAVHGRARRERPIPYP